MIEEITAVHKALGKFYRGPTKASTTEGDENATLAFLEHMTAKLPKLGTIQL